MSGHWTYIVEWTIQLVVIFVPILFCGSSYIISRINIHGIVQIYAYSGKTESLVYRRRVKELYSVHHL